MNVVLSAAGRTLAFVQELKQALGKSASLAGANLAYEFVFRWLINKMDYLMSKGMQMQDFEEFRSIGVAFIQSMDDNEGEDK